MIKITIATRFNQYVQGDLWFCWDLPFLLIIDEHLRYKVTAQIADRKQETIMRWLLHHWIRYFGPMETLVFDQEGSVTSEAFSRFCDRFSVSRVFSGTDDHTRTGLVERHIFLTRLCALKIFTQCQQEGLAVSKDEIAQEAGMCQNLMISYENATPAQGLLGYTPRDYYTPETTALDSYTGAIESSPDVGERAVRLRLIAKSMIMQGIIEERIARANRTRVEKQDLKALKESDTVDIYRLPDRKDQSGWRGPADLLKISDGTAIVVWNGLPYIISLRHVRQHIGYSIRTHMTYFHNNSYTEQAFAAFPTTESLWALMDNIDSTTPGTTTTIGKIVDDNGIIQYRPSAEGLQSSAMWKLIIDVAISCFNMVQCDGAVPNSSSS